jgi:hypothetical protein
MGRTHTPDPAQRPARARWCRSPTSPGAHPPWAPLAGSSLAGVASAPPGWKACQRMRAAYGAGTYVPPHAYEQMQVVAAVRSAIGPAAVKRAEHPLLLANERSHVNLPPCRSRILLDPRPFRTLEDSATLIRPAFNTHISNGEIPSPKTYKSRFTQNVNRRPTHARSLAGGLDAARRSVWWARRGEGTPGAWPLRGGCEGECARRESNPRPAA